MLPAAVRFSTPHFFYLMPNKGTDLLRLLNLPVFRDMREFAAAIDLPPSTLMPLIHRTHKQYKRYFIPKRNGELRLIAQPNRFLKAVQAWILRSILDKLHASPHATAYIRGQTLRDNVEPHVRNRYFICIDIEDFFPSIKSQSVKAVFETIGYKPVAATLLANLCCFRDRLPQGGVTSPSLSNLICLELDRKLAAISATRIVTYTRYADDITFSANDPTALRGLVSEVREVLRSQSFRLNYRKIKIFGPSKRCCITGFTKNSSESRFSVGSKKKRMMRAVMLRMAVGGAVTGPYQTVQAIEGWLAFLQGNDLDSYAQMKKYWDDIRIKAHLAKLLSSISGSAGYAAPIRDLIVAGPLGALSMISDESTNEDEARIEVGELRCIDGRTATEVAFKVLRNNSPSFPRLTSIELKFEGGAQESFDKSRIESVIMREDWQRALLSHGIGEGRGMSVP